jgi:hypothetical protein
MLWGTEAHLAEIFGDAVEWQAHNRRVHTFRFVSAQQFADFFIEYYGPTLKAHAALGDEGTALRTALTDLAAQWNRLDPSDGAVAIPGEYLESVGIRS